MSFDFPMVRLFGVR